MAVLENDKIERHIMKNIPGGHNLFVQDKEVAGKIENIYSVRLNYDDKCFLLSKKRKALYRCRNSVVVVVIIVVVVFVHKNILDKILKFLPNLFKILCAYVLCLSNWYC